MTFNLPCRIYAAIILVLVGCNKPKSSEIQETNKHTKAERIVLQSVELHGGLDAFDHLETISFNKITILFDSSGNEESRILQKHRFRFRPQLEGTVEWVDKGDSIKIVFAEDQGTRFVNNILDNSGSEAARNAIFAALYVLFQPFKLLDQGTRLALVGNDSMDGISVNIVQPVYEGAKPEDDQWLFYFSSETNELIANRVNHKGRYSLIKNLAFDTTTRLMLHQHRKSYFVDSLNNVLYLRAEYFYKDYNLNFLWD